MNIKFMKSFIIKGTQIAGLATPSGFKLMPGTMLERGLSSTNSAKSALLRGCFDFIYLDTNFSIKGWLTRSPYLDDSVKFNLQRAAPGIGIETRFR